MFFTRNRFQKSKTEGNPLKIVQHYDTSISCVCFSSLCNAVFIYHKNISIMDRMVVVVNVEGIFRSNVEASFSHRDGQSNVYMFYLEESNEQKEEEVEFELFWSAKNNYWSCNSGEKFVFSSKPRNSPKTKVETFLSLISIQFLPFILSLTQFCRNSICEDISTTGQNHCMLVLNAKVLFLDMFQVAHQSEKFEDKMYDQSCRFFFQTHPFHQALEFSLRFKRVGKAGVGINFYYETKVDLPTVFSVFMFVIVITEFSNIYITFNCKTEEVYKLVQDLKKQQTK